MVALLRFCLLLIPCSMINRMAELQIASNSESSEVAASAKVAFDLETKLSEQLIALKADILTTQSLQTQITELREAKVTSEERNGAKDLQINDLINQLSQLQEAKNSLTEKLDQLEARISEQTARPSSEELEGAKQDLDVAKRKLDAAEETEMTLRAELDALKESVQLKEGEIKSMTIQKLESERKASVANL